MGAMRMMKVPVVTGAAFAFVLGTGLFVVPASGNASTIDDLFGLTLNGMSSGVCPLGTCGTIDVKGDPTVSLTYTVDLATGVSFHGNHTGSSGTGPVFYFELTDPTGNPAISFKNVGTSGTIGTKAYSYNAPTSGSFAPNPGNFPGTYNYEVTCTNDTAGKICNSPSTGPLTFKATGANSSDSFVIGAPLGHGLFPTDDIAFVADLSITADTNGLCGGDACTTGTGMVGSSLISSTIIKTTPTPAAWILMLTGLIGIAFFAYRRQKQNAVPVFS